MSAILLYLLHNVSSFLPVYLSSDKYMIIIFASGHNNYGNLMVNKLNFRSQGIGSSTVSQLTP